MDLSRFVCNYHMICPLEVVSTIPSRAKYAYALLSRFYVDALSRTMRASVVLYYAQHMPVGYAI